MVALVSLSGCLNENISSNSYSNSSQNHSHILVNNSTINNQNISTSNNTVGNSKNITAIKNVVHFAKYFKLYPHWNEGYCILIDSVGNKFVLLNRSAKNPNIPNAKVIYVPINRTITDFYCPIISTADILNNYHSTIVGAPKYAIEDSPKLEKLYKEGKVVNVGKPGNMNYETITNLNPEIVFLGSWPCEDSTQNMLKKLGITVSRFYTYKEPTYMGRVEWIKYASAFWGANAYNKAKKWFGNVVKVRDNILEKVQNTTKKPTVAIISWSSTENSPAVYGNDSYYSKMVEEFGGYNIFSNYSGGYQPIDKETFYEKAINADVVILIWYYGTNISNETELLNINPEFANFKAFKDGRFYVSHPDYYVWESRDPAGYMMDYAKMLHPELFGGDSDLKYYYKIVK